jgi:hypothetical protein
MASTNECQRITGHLWDSVGIIENSFKTSQN